MARKVKEAELRKRLDVRDLLLEALANGIQGGLNKHEKYCDTVYNRESIEHHVYNYVELALDELIDWED